MPERGLEGVGWGERRIRGGEREEEERERERERGMESRILNLLIGAIWQKELYCLPRFIIKIPHWFFPEEGLQPPPTKLAFTTQPNWQARYKATA